MRSTETVWKCGYMSFWERLQQGRGFNRNLRIRREEMYGLTVQGI